jgi:hypothetical protein
VIEPDTVPVSRVSWSKARRIIRSAFPPIDLFEDIAPPEDWPTLMAAEQKTNPRLMSALGMLDLVPPARRVSGPGATFLMAPFTHVSTDRPSRFSDGSYGVLYAANRFETALLETMFHHAQFMARTCESPGWTSQFRELVFDVESPLHDLRDGNPRWAPALAKDSYTESQRLGRALREVGSEGLVFPSQRDADGECVGMFFPDLASHLIQAKHLDYHWDGKRVDLYRDAGSGQVFRVQYS